MSVKTAEDYVVDCRMDLRAWLERKENDGTPHEAVLTALALMAASGSVIYGISKETFLAQMARYYDVYKEATAS